VLGRIPLKSLAPGKYSLAVKVTDLISNRTITSNADFKVNQPPESLAASRPGAPAAP
jgi:hypothetical protein